MPVSKMIDSIFIGRKYERDIDLLLAEEFWVSADFAKWFLMQTKTFAEAEAEVDGVYVSKSEAAGESDLVIIYRKNIDGAKFALLIEDKIDAPLQREQLERYQIRAKSEISRAQSTYSEAEIIVCAPSAYKTAHPEIELLATFVPYESVVAFFKEQQPIDARNEYRAHFMNSASNKKVNTSIVSHDETTDNFWKATYDIARHDFSELEMKPFKEKKYAKGTTWISFRPHDMPSLPKMVKVDLKGASGFVDLTFNHVVGRDFQPLVKSILETVMDVQQTGRASAIRICVTPFTIVEDFNAMRAQVTHALQTSARLIRFYFKHREQLDAAAFAATPQGE